MKRYQIAISYNHKVHISVAFNIGSRNMVGKPADADADMRDLSCDGNAKAKRKARQKLKKKDKGRSTGLLQLPSSSSKCEAPMEHYTADEGDTNEHPDQGNAGPSNAGPDLTQNTCIGSDLAPTEATAMETRKRKKRRR